MFPWILETPPPTAGAWGRTGMLFVTQAAWPSVYDSPPHEETPTINTPINIHNYIFTRVYTGGHKRSHLAHILHVYSTNPWKSHNPSDNQ